MSSVSNPSVSSVLDSNVLAGEQVARQKISDERNIIYRRHLIGRLLSSFENLLRHADACGELIVVSHHYDEFDAEMFEYIFHQMFANPEPNEEEKIPFDE